MNFDFRKGTITIVVSPTDLRCGFDRLSSIAITQLGIDVMKRKDLVVFVSRAQRMAKMIWTDAAGVNTLVRRLQAGRFERFLAKVDEPATRRFDYDDLMSFLDGKPIMVKRTKIHENI